MNTHRLSRAARILVLITCALALAETGTPADEPIALGTRRELFVDRLLIESMSNARLELHAPRDEGVSFRFDQPWEGAFCGYCTVLHRNGRYQLYYRGKSDARPDGQGEVTCYAESDDGKQWRRPDLGQIEWNGSKQNNILIDDRSISHNFSPFIDTRAGVPADQLYKALGGTKLKGPPEPGLYALASADGIRWRHLVSNPVITQGALDSQNVAFWSEVEQCYVCYLRIFTGGTTTTQQWAPKGYRTIARMTSSDFCHWSPFVPMKFEPPQQEHLYTNQTQPYFRAPHIYLATAARFMPGRQVLTDDEARAVQVDPAYFKDTSDAVLLSSRGGTLYDRTFGEALVRPGIGAHNWTSRSNYPALNVVQTGPTEMSLYVNQDYAQPTAHLHRYSWRLDGFASVRALYDPGEMTTQPIAFTGKRLMLNFSTSAAGSIRVEIQDPQGKAVPGYSLDDSVELIGNEIERAVRWKSGTDVSLLVGRPVRLRLVLRDADLFALRFAE